MNTCTLRRYFSPHIFIICLITTPGLALAQDSLKAVNDLFQINEDDSLNVQAPGILGNDIDVDTDSATAVLLESPVTGELIFQPDGAFVYTPQKDYFGADSFSYKIVLDSLESNEAIVFIDILPINDPPVAIDDGVNTLINQGVEISLEFALSNDFDIDNDVLLEPSILDYPENGELIINGDGTLHYQPNIGFYGIDKFLYMVSDSLLLSDTASIVIGVNQSNFNKVGQHLFPFIEWELYNPTYQGNPYDVIASVEFQHLTGATHKTEMFYAGDYTWKFRFTATGEGTWSFLTSSIDPDLDDKAGSIIVHPNPGEMGFVTNLDGRWGRSGTGKAFVPQYVMYKNLTVVYEDTSAVDDDIQLFFEEHGFNGFHSSVSNRWFDVNEASSDQISENNPVPDERTFATLETLISKIYNAGGVLHLWMWGDDSRNLNQKKWGINGEVDRRLQRYICARLGAMPGWTMSYGFDLQEWVSDEDVQSWYDFMTEKLGWAHLLSARNFGPLNYEPGIVFEQIISNPGYASYEQHKPSYDAYLAAFNSRPDIPVFSEDRFRLREIGLKKDYSPDEIRQGLWHSMMVGGVANIWGNQLIRNDSGVSAPFPNIDEIKTHFEFFKTRYSKEMVADTTFSNAVALRRTNTGNFVLYQEDTDSIQIELTLSDTTKPLIALDAKMPYLEIPIDTLRKTNQVWRAPYISDWAISYGDFADTLTITDSVNISGGVPSLMNVITGLNGSGQVSSEYIMIAEVTDLLGEPVAGVHLKLEIIGEGVFNAVQDFTDIRGKCILKPELPAVSGRYIGRLSSTDISNQIIDIQLNVLSAEATHLKIIDGDEQTGTIGRELVFPFVIQLQDLSGNPVTSENLFWEVLSEGSLRFETVMVDSNGIARNYFTPDSSVGLDSVKVALNDSIFTIFTAYADSNIVPIFTGLKDTSVVEKNVIAFPVNAVDEDGSVVRYEVRDLPDGAGFTTPGNVFFWTPPDSSVGDYEITFLAYDNENGLGARRITISVLEDNNPPEITSFLPVSTDFPVVERDLVDFEIFAADKENDSFSTAWKVDGGLVGGSFTYRFNAKQFAAGAHIIEAIVSDSVNSSIQKWQVTVVSEQIASKKTIQLAAGDNQSMTVGRALNFPIKVFITNPEGSPVAGRNVVWNLTDDKAGANLRTLESVTDTVGVAINFWTLGSDTGAYKAEAFLSYDQPLVQFTAHAVQNNFPVFETVRDTFVYAGKKLKLQFIAMDADEETITFGSENLPDGAIIHNETGDFEWSPTEQQVGLHPILVRATDSQGGFGVANFQIQVKEKNSPPEIVQFMPSSLILALFPSGSHRFTVQAIDAENQPLSYRWSNNGVFVSDSSSYLFSLGENPEPQYIVRVVISDGLDSLALAWQLSIVTAVELINFTAEFGGFSGVKVAWDRSENNLSSSFKLLRGFSEDGEFEALKSTGILFNAKSKRYEFTDNADRDKQKHFYILEKTLPDQRVRKFGPISVETELPETFQLYENFPNPFNGGTKIRFQLPESTQISLKIYNILGREVKSLLNEKKEAGYYTIQWDGTNENGSLVGSGVYYYQIRTGDRRVVKKMLLLK